MDKKIFRKNDIYLVLVFLLAFLFILLFINLSKEKGTLVRVSVDGQVTAAYPLDEDLDVVIDGYDGGTNRLVIDSGQAYLKDTSCPDHLCEKMGRISQVGQSIICLPNRVVVEVAGDGSSSEYDAVVGG